MRNLFNKYWLAIVVFVICFLALATLAYAAPTVTQIQNGGTGTSTFPAYGNILIGGKNGEYEYVSSSTLAAMGAVLSFNGRAGAVVPQSGDYTTSLVTEGSNLYFTNARAISALTGQNVSIFTNDAGYLTSATLGGPFYTFFHATTTDALAEGVSNLYFTNARSDARFIADLTATTSVKSITTLSSLSLPYSQITGTPDLTQYLTLSAWYGTTTDQLKEGSANLYFTNARADARFVAGLAGTTSVASITTLGNLSVPYSQLTGVPAFDTFAYPFPAAATSTKLTFNGGLISTASSTLTNATTTGTLYATIASSSQLFGADLSSCSGTNALTWSGGTFGCVALSQGSVTSVTASFPVQSSGGATPNITFVGLSTTTPWTQSNLAFVASNNTLSSVGTSTLSASSPLTGSFTQVGSGGSIGCQTASGSQAGCLSSSDWNTFNGKQSTISATWPITLSGAAVGFNGLSTTSPLSAASGLLYATGVNTVASVSTSSAINLSITGNAGTATALAANGSNCGAGFFPLGVDASGNSESCTYAAATTSPWGANQLVYTNNIGQLVSVASSSLHLPNSALANSSITVNSTTFNLGDNKTITAASSTLLSNTNLFSGLTLFNAGILDNSASSTINGNATTTGTFFASIASSTSLYGAGLSSCTGGTNALTWSGGTFGCQSITASGGAAFPFTPLSNFAVNTSATTTPIWDQVGIFASSTSQFDQLNIGSTTTGTMSTSTDSGNWLVKGTASTTQLIVSGLGGAATTNVCAQASGFLTTTGCNNGTVTSIATNNGLTGGTITTSGAIGLATINAGVLGAPTNGSVPTSQATSTLYGTGIGGNVLTWANGVPSWVATTTDSCSSGITCSFSGTAESFSIGSNALTLGMFPQIASQNVLVNNTSATGNVVAISTTTLFGTLGTPGQVLMSSNGSAVWTSTSTAAAGSASSTLLGDTNTWGGNDYFNNAVGIGTTTPSNKLEVNGGIGVRGGLTTNGGPGLFIGFSSSIGTVEAFNAGVAGLELDLVGYPFVFKNANNGSEMGRFDINNNFGIGTTTPIDMLTSVASSKPQLALSDALGSNLWTFRNIGGNLFLATSTYTATSSPAAIEIDNNATTTFRNGNGYDFGAQGHGMRIIPGATTTLQFY